MIQVITIVRNKHCLLASHVSVLLHTTHPRDEEERRLFGAYEASSAKEHTAASKLLNPHHSLSHPAYRKLLGDLRAIRTECNVGMLAIAAHRREMPSQVDILIRAVSPAWHRDS
jgi:hypothetical protein